MLGPARRVLMLPIAKDNTDAADVDLAIWKNNCNGTVVDNRLQKDFTYDVKSMTKAGPEAAGEALCAKVHTRHVPGTQTRKVILIMYYSNETEFR